MKPKIFKGEIFYVFRGSGVSTKQFALKTLSCSSALPQFTNILSHNGEICDSMKALRLYSDSSLYFPVFFVLLDVVLTQTAFCVDVLPCLNFMY